MRQDVYHNTFLEVLDHGRHQDGLPDTAQGDPVRLLHDDAFVEITIHSPANLYHH